MQLWWCLWCSLFVRTTSGFWVWRTEKAEGVNGYEAKVKPILFFKKALQLTDVSLCFAFISWIFQFLYFPSRTDFSCPKATDQTPLPFFRHRMLCRINALWRYCGVWYAGFLILSAFPAGGMWFQPYRRPVENIFCGISIIVKRIEKSKCSILCWSPVC